MARKDSFINYVEKVMEIAKIEMDEEAKSFWEALKVKEETEKSMFTENGKMVLKFLQDNQDTETWKAKDIGEQMGISSRTASGAMRKLITDGYVDKVGKDPVLYVLTENGKNIVIE